MSEEELYANVNSCQNETPREDCVNNPVTRDGSFSGGVSPDVQHNLTDPLPSSRLGDKNPKMVCLISTTLLLSSSVVLLSVAFFVGTFCMLPLLQKLQQVNDHLTSLNHIILEEKTQLQIGFNEVQKEKENLELKLSALSGGCASGWKNFSGKCYYFSTDMKNWTESRDACVTMGGHLVIIESEEEQKFLSEGHEQWSYWIGLTNLVPEGDWRWVDNTPLSDSSRFWCQAELDSQTGDEEMLAVGNNCTQINFSTPCSGRWLDAVCGNQKLRICESKAAISEGGIRQ